MVVQIAPSWEARLKDEFEAPYFRALTDYVKREYQSETVYPASNRIFRAFDLCPFEKVKIVILGQDPYHGRGQANGLSFAVEKGIPLPPSLRNIFKEIESEFGEPLVHRDGDLTRWADQGVLLMNATLTVRAHLPNSHRGKGWEKITDAAISALSLEREHLVFMLWGNHAKKKGVHIDRTRHLVLESPHPSPFSAASGFFGNGHFMKANDYLAAHGKALIDWS